MARGRGDRRRRRARVLAGRAPTSLERVEIEIEYEGYLRRQEADAARVARADAVRVPDELDYRDIPGLSNEVVEKLEAIRPRSVGQASRISGVTPAAVAILLTHIGLVARRKAADGTFAPLMKAIVVLGDHGRCARRGPRSAAAQAGGLFLPGAGAMSTSRAGAAVASADDGEALGVNPAGPRQAKGTDHHARHRRVIDYSMSFQRRGTYDDWRRADRPRTQGHGVPDGRERRVEAAARPRLVTSRCR